MCLFQFLENPPLFSFSNSKISFNRNLTNLLEDAVRMMSTASPWPVRPRASRTRGTFIKRGLSRVFQYKKGDAHGNHQRGESQPEPDARQGRGRREERRPRVQPVR